MASPTAQPDAALAPSPAPVKKPGHRKGGPKVNLRWREDFLADYAEHGGLYHAAQTAGVNSSTVYAEMERAPAFRQAAEEARQRFADSREMNLRTLADKGNVVGDIVLLKKHRPAEYIEKNLTLTASFTTQLAPEDGKALLQAMLGHATGATTQALTPGET